MTKADAFRKKARAMGAAGAKIIDPSTVATAAWVRLKCQYGCGGYGGCLCCPSSLSSTLSLVPSFNLSPARHVAAWRMINPRKVAHLQTK
jgi:hypothetical protein